MTAFSPRAAMLVRRASALYCATHGTGTPLLLIHGLGASGTMFQPLIQALSADHFVIVPDLRGHGHSCRLPSADIAQMAADVEELLDLLHVPSCTVLGYAEGGMIAQQLARAYPKRIDGLILINSAAQTAASVREQVERRLRGEAARLLHGKAAPTTCAFDSRAWLAHIHCPTLVIGGAGDAIAVQHANNLANRLPNVQLRLTPGTADTCLSSHAPALLDRMLPWLNKHEVAC